MKSKEPSQDIDDILNEDAGELARKSRPNRANAAENRAAKASRS